MKRFNFFLLSFMTMPCLFAQTKLTDTQKADALIRQMTLEEKVGQMTQVTYGVIQKKGNDDGVLDDAALKNAVIDHKVGSILNTGGHALAVDAWQRVITSIQDEAKKTRLKIPVIYGL